ncbi:hypothetical protein [Flavobacterium cerinum]|uniref:Uncharacterized protein n=1 Tax=Flavobacterium cerinum TaxID=2502784 RepID=A0A444HCV4_9FLAO|nr:hypothetical protein [Flavobacterium cerinum]RWX01598.1 hypothetical protein EPI11_06510 [Flavobacterium cerinum]
MSGQFINSEKLILFVFVFWFYFIGCFAQNARDIFIKDSIYPILNTEAIKNKAEYLKLKEGIVKLEKQYGYETNLKKRILEAAYVHNDITYFKAELTLLVKDHGFDVAYMSGDENYYSAIMKGALTKWFKEMYLKSHSEWLNNNFDKQIELRKLNAIHEKDQFVTSFAMNVLNVPGLDTAQKDAVKEHLAEYHYKTLLPVLDVVKTRNLLPNDKNFAVLQNNYDTALIHNLQFKGNMDRVWEILFPVYKNAYMAYDITNVMFQNYDFYHYQHYGTQVFDSYTIDQIPEQSRKGNKAIPVEDAVWLGKLKKEFKWTE